MSNKENQVDKVINELKKVQNVEEILNYMVKYMGNKQLRECINNLSDEAKFDFKTTGTDFPKAIKPKRGKRTGWKGKKSLINDISELEKLGLTEVKVEGDGNCQFRSIAVLLGKKQTEWKSIKTAMLKCLKENTVGMVGEGVAEDKKIVGEARYILETNGAWGDELTLNIARNCFNINIHIYDAKNKNLIPDHGSRPMSGYVIWNGYHYNAAQKMADGAVAVIEGDNVCVNVARKLSGTYCALVACDEKNNKFIIAGYMKGEWKLRKNGAWLSEAAATNPKICLKLKSGKKFTKLTVAKAEELLQEKGISNTYHRLLQVGEQWEKGSSSFGSSFGSSVQKNAAKKNLYIVGARTYKTKEPKFLVYKFDSKKKDWVRKNKKPVAKWMSMGEIRKTKNTISGKPSKKCMENFMSIRQLYISPKQFKFGKDTQFGPLKPSSFGVGKWIKKEYTKNYKEAIKNRSLFLGPTNRTGYPAMSKQIRQQKLVPMSK